MVTLPRLVVECYMCSAKLVYEVDLPNEDDPPGTDAVLLIHPCPACMKDAEDCGYSEGYHNE